jgi:NAD(P) transhydrogenase subunit alpha
MPVTVAALKERAPGEKRVALVPEVVSKLVAEKYTVLIESGAGDAAFFSDAAYKQAGAKVVPLAEALKASIILTVNRPPATTLAKIGKDQVLIGLLDSLADAKELEATAKRGAAVLSLDRLPRQVSRAQSMDALITAAGTARPAKVLVLGAGVAGLQAIGTAKRLGAQVSGYDVRPAAREEVVSMGAQFLQTSIESAAGEGGYARQLTKEESAKQQKELGAQIAKFDVVITTAKVPGKKPPVLVTKDVVAAMGAGSVLVDIAASSLGGNVEGSAPGKNVLTKNGATIIAGDTLASDMASAASFSFAKNLEAVVKSIVKEGQIVLDPEDEVTAALTVAAKGAAK